MTDKIRDIPDERATLTRFEHEALQQGGISLADGHATDALPESLMPAVEDMPSIWTTTGCCRVVDAERQFGRIFGDAAGSAHLSGHKHFRICPTASNSIDLTAAFLTGRRVALLHPTFDNLALLMHRRGVELVPLGDEALYEALQDGRFADLLAALQADALFLVNPNNPTGIALSEAALRTIAEACAERGVILVLDSTFRFFLRPTFDDYGVLLASGVTFIGIEDTGKTLSTQDMKASMLCFSPDIAPYLNELYEELYLCASPFSLGVLGALLERSTAVGFDAVVRGTVARRRADLRAALVGSVLQVAPVAEASMLSVEWLEIQEPRMTDLDVVGTFAAAGVAVLPGRPFYWDAPDEPAHQRFVRISLLRPAAEFAEALKRIARTVWWSAL